MFGQGWYADAETSILSEDGRAVYIDEDATTHVFTKKSDGTYQPPTGVYLELTETSDQFVLKTKDQTNAYFSKKGGKLQKIVDGHNNTTVYEYNDSNQLTAITDASGRKLTFTYDENGHVTSLTGRKTKRFHIHMTKTFSKR